jgi:hypothetical protein
VLNSVDLNGIRGVASSILSTPSVPLADPQDVAPAERKTRMRATAILFYVFQLLGDSATDLE